MPGKFGEALDDEVAAGGREFAAASKASGDSASDDAGCPAGVHVNGAVSNHRSVIHRRAATSHRCVKRGWIGFTLRNAVTSENYAETVP